MSVPLIQIRGPKVFVEDDAARLESVATSLRDDWFVRLPALLDAETVERALRELDRETHSTMEHPGIGVEACFRASPTFARLEFLLNAPPLLALIERITCAPHIGSFNGRIYRVVPGAGHHDSWHSDTVRDRVVALSLNLGRDRYEGGTLQMRSKGSESCVEVPNLVTGDAVLFRLDTTLEHRITDIRGRAPKTALAGWYCSSPEFAERFHAARR